MHGLVLNPNNLIFMHHSLLLGRFGPCAIVTVFSSSSILRPIATELKAAIAASFRSGLPVEPERIKFSFVKTDAANSEDGETVGVN
jgi:hypothetical protein